MFQDASESSEIARRLVGIMNHATACGDVDGDGTLDLFVGTFCDRPAAAYKGADGPVPNVLLLNRGGRFVDSGQTLLAWKGRTSGAVFADLDNDGDVDLYATNNSVRAIFLPNKLFENVGGKFRDVSAGNAACVQMGGRSVGVLDFDGDGLLDLLVCEDVPGRTRLMRNRGKLQFEDATARAGLPDLLPGLGVVTPDVNNDGRPDIFVTPANRLLLSRGDGTYREATELQRVFKYKLLEGDPCGVAFGDIDRDGDLDLFIADHTKKPGAKQHLFVNCGLRNGVPDFRGSIRRGRPGLHLPQQERGRVARQERTRGDCRFRQRRLARPVRGRHLGRRRAADAVRRAQPRPRARPRRCASSRRRSRRSTPISRPAPSAITTATAGSTWSCPVGFPRSPRSCSSTAAKATTGWKSPSAARPSTARGVGCKVKVYPAGKLGNEKELLGFQEISNSQGFCTGTRARRAFRLGARSPSATCR